MSVSDADDPSRLRPKLTNINLEAKRGEDLDIYSDILTDQDQHISKLKQLNEKLTTEKSLLIKSTSSLQNNYEQLLKEFKELESKYNKVRYNSSALLKTAQAEIKRKDKMIVELRRKNDNLVFRKTSRSSSRDDVRRSTAESRRKLKSPMKRRERTPKRDRTCVPTLKEEESCVPNAEHEVSCIPNLKKEEISLQETNHEVDTPRECGMEDVTANNDAEDCVSKVNDRIITDNSKVPSLISKDSLENKVMPILPPLQGPMTAFSKRQYKKIHGVSPQKVILPNIENDDNISLDDHDITVDDCQPSSQHMKEKVPLVNSDTLCQIESGEMISLQIKDESKTTVEYQSTKVALKLKEQVNEFIKLGPTSPTKNSSLPKSSPELKKSSPENGFRKNVDLKSSPQGLVIQCDLRINTSELQNSPNSVSVNETLNNVIKQYRSQLLTSNAKTLSLEQNQSSSQNKLSSCVQNELNVEPLKKNSQNQKNSVKPKRLLSVVNKKPSNKPIISPVTFGNLIPPKNQISPGNKNVDDTTNINYKKVNNAKISAKKKKVFTTLFGDSPSKCSFDSKVPGSDLNKGGVDKSSSPSSTYSPLRTTSPIFPSSPSLDSDDSNDLVIDTAACSQNQSPQVSVSKIQVNRNDSKKSVFDVLSKRVDQEAINTPPHSNSQNEGLKVLLNVLTNQNLPETLNNKNPPSVEKTDTQEAKSVVGEDSKNIQKETSLKIGLPDLAQCFSLDTHDLPLKQSSENTDMVFPPSKVQGKDICTKWSSSGEILNGLIKNSKQHTDKTSTSVSSELTLLTALKHSENSVLNMTEDTIGFVSALTRVRDISPIRTPDKKTKELVNEEKENKVSPKSQMNDENLVVNSSEISPSVLLSMPLSKETTPANLTKNVSEISIQQNTLKVEEKVIEASIELIESECLKPDSKPYENSTIVKVDNTLTNVEHNVFRRKKPVRILKIQSKSSSETLASSEKENINTFSVPINKTVPSDIIAGNIAENEPNVGQSPKRDGEIHSSQKCGEENIAKDNIKLNPQSENISNNATNNLEIPLKGINEQKGKLSDEKQFSGSLDERTGMNKTNSSKCLTKPQKTQLGSAKNISIPTEIVKSTFKRSNTLKTMKKPIPQVDYDILSKPEDEKDVTDRRNLRSSLYHNELDQTPHIANINRKVRVSNFKRDCDQLKKTIVSKTKSENAKDSRPKGVTSGNCEIVSENTLASKKERNPSRPSKSNTSVSSGDSLRLGKVNNNLTKYSDIDKEKVQTKNSELVNKNQQVNLGTDEEKCESEFMKCSRKTTPESSTTRTKNNNIDDNYSKTRIQDEMDHSKTEENVSKQLINRKSPAMRSRNKSRSESRSPEPKRRSKSLHEPQYSNSSKTESKYNSSMKSFSPRNDSRNNCRVDHRSRDRTSQRSRRYRRSRSRSSEYRSRHYKSCDRSRDSRRSRDRSFRHDRRKRSRSPSPEIPMQKSRKLETEDNIQSSAGKENYKKSSTDEQSTNFAKEIVELRRQLELFKKEHEEKAQLSSQSVKVNATSDKESVPTSGDLNFEFCKSSTLEEIPNVNSNKPAEPAVKNVLANSILIPNKPVKVLRRKSRTLGDSDVVTVSFPKKT